MLKTKTSRYRKLHAIQSKLRKWIGKRWTFECDNVDCNVVEETTYQNFLSENIDNVICYNNKTHIIQLKKRSCPLGMSYYPVKYDRKNFILSC